MENNFDHFFKDKLEHQEFEMKPEYWEGAEALIEADESNRDWRRFFVWFGVAVMVGGVVFFAWKNDASNELVGNEKIPNTTLENVFPESKEKSKATDEVFYKEESVVEESAFENNLSSKNEEENNSVNVLLGKNAPAKVEGYISNKSLSSKVVNSNSSHSNQNEFSKTIPSLETKEKEENGINNANTSTGNNSNKNTLIITSIDAKNKSEINESLKEKESTVQSIASNSTILLPFLEMFLASKKRIEALDFNTVWFNTPSIDKYVGGIFGGVVGYPLKENNSDNSFIGFKSGILLERNFKIGKANMAVGTELTYHYRSGNFVATKQNEVAKYSFGRSITQAKLTPENLHYFELPLYLKYQKKRMTFETGVSFNYLLGVRGKVIEANGTPQSGWIPSLGFKNNYVNVLLGFHYRISDNLYFGVRTNYTSGGILDSNAELPEEVTVVLQESKPFYVTFRVTQYLKFKK